MNDSMHFASATTTLTDAEAAVADLAAQVGAQMDGRSIDFALVFVSRHYTQSAVLFSDRLRAVLAPSVLLGCTAEGVIGREREIEQSPAITLVAARMPAVELAPFAIHPAEWGDILDDPVQFREKIGATEATKLVVLLADPFSTPMDKVLTTFNEYVRNVPVVGGVASGAQRPHGNALLLNDQILNGGAVGLAFSGALDVEVIVSQGCRPVGDPVTVTEARENVIHSIEGEPSLQRIQQIITSLPSEDQALLDKGLHLGRAIDRGDEALGRGDYLIRTLVGSSQETGAVAVNDIIHAGEHVQLHVRDAATAQEDLEMLLATQAFSDPPVGAFLFSCNGRGTRLYDHPNGDISTIQAILGGVELAGFFCAGEIGPVAGENFLHGHTASLALIRPIVIE